MDRDFNIVFEKSQELKSEIEGTDQIIFDQEDFEEISELCRLATAISEPELPTYTST